MNVIPVRGRGSYQSPGGPIGRDLFPKGPRACGANEKPLRPHHQNSVFDLKMATVISKFNSLKQTWLCSPNAQYWEFKNF